MYKSRRFRDQDQEPSPNERRLDIKSTQTDHEIKDTCDMINILEEKRQTDAMTITNLEQEATQKQQEIQRLKRLLEKHIPASRCEESSAKQVNISSSLSDRPLQS